MGARIDTHCPYCSLQCGITLTPRPDGTLDLEGRDDPVNRGGLCIKGASAAELLAVHDRFCQGFAKRDPEQVLATVADTPELVVVTSESALLRGAHELRSFLERYAAGPTTYSWTWDGRDTAAFATCGAVRRQCRIFDQYHSEE